MHVLALTAILVSGGVFDAADSRATAPSACSACIDHGGAPCGPLTGDAVRCSANAHDRSVLGSSCTRCAHFRRTLYARPYDYRNLLDYPWHAPRRLPASTFHHRRFAEPQVEHIPPAAAPAPVPVDPSASTLAPRPGIARRAPPSAATPAAYYGESF